MREPFVYVIAHPSYRSVKVGHSSERNGQSDRLECLARDGWQVHRRLYVVTPEIAYRVEQAVLFQIRHRFHAPAHLPQGSMPTGGWTETASAQLVSAATVWDVVCEEASLIQLASDQPRRRVSNRMGNSKPLDATHLRLVRQRAQELGDAQKLSVRLVKQVIGGSATEYAVRLRNYIQDEVEQP